MEKLNNNSIIAVCEILTVISKPAGGNWVLFYRHLSHLCQLRGVNRGLGAFSPGGNLCRYLPQQEIRAFTVGCWWPSLSRSRV